MNPLNEALQLLEQICTHDGDAFKLQSGREYREDFPQVLCTIFEFEEGIKGLSLIYEGCSSMSPDCVYTRGSKRSHTWYMCSLDALKNRSHGGSVHEVAQSILSTTFHENTI